MHTLYNLLDHKEIIDKSLVWNMYRHPWQDKTWTIKFAPRYSMKLAQDYKKNL